jgi:hypothetical protein
MPLLAEVLGNRTIRGQETLGVPGRLEPLHASLPLTRGLVGILRAVIEVATLPMFHTGQHLPVLTRNSSAGLTRRRLAIKHPSPALSFRSCSFAGDLLPPEERDLQTPHGLEQFSV